MPDSRTIHSQQRFIIKIGRACLDPKFKGKMPPFIRGDGKQKQEIVDIEDLSQEEATIKVVKRLFCKLGKTTGKTKKDIRNVISGNKNQFKKALKAARIREPRLNYSYLEYGQKVVRDTICQKYLEYEAQIWRCQKKISTDHDNLQKLKDFMYCLMKLDNFCLKSDQQRFPVTSMLQRAKKDRAQMLQSTVHGENTIDFIQIQENNIHQNKSFFDSLIGEEQNLIKEPSVQFRHQNVVSQTENDKYDCYSQMLEHSKSAQDEIDPLLNFQSLIDQKNILLRWF